MTSEQMEELEKRLADMNLGARVVDVLRTLYARQETLEQQIAELVLVLERHKQVLEALGGHTQEPPEPSPRGPVN